MTNFASDSGLTVGAGGGGGAGIGAILGVNLAASIQLVATPSREIGLAITGGYGNFVLGVGYIAGGQASISNAQNLNDVRGSGFDFGISAGGSYGADLDYTISPDGRVKGGSLTVGPAGGGRVSTGATYTHTWVPFSTNCGG